VGGSITPRNKFAISPDKAIAIGHRHEIHLLNDNKLV
jgi:hypothetical protein